MTPNALSVSEMLLQRYEEIKRRDAIIKTLYTRAERAEAILAAIQDFCERTSESDPPDQFSIGWKGLSDNVLALLGAAQERK
jgi:hypothetical protein